ncbi:hypothetical protein ILUMI_26399 [Ignelater luminosus]|uniref:DDE-1 domain-containing protein n=1 Tax=Ignelater luminosus TaxID=2038154 RepID=A0A8K0C4D2_IGNLU|nr:hypothetical protein ILUMI_26399 [Ignelater luminosus]
MGYLEASQPFGLPQTTLKRRVKEAQESGFVARSCTKDLRRMKPVFTFEQEIKLSSNQRKSPTDIKSVRLIDKAHENHVILMCIPPHSSHKLQPLDVSFMASLNHFYSEESRKWMQEHPGVFDDVFQVWKEADTGKKKHENIDEASENASTPGPSGSMASEDKTSVESLQTPMQKETSVGLFSILVEGILPVPDVPFRKRKETTRTGKVAILMESHCKSSLLDSFRKTPKRKLFDNKPGNRNHLLIAND